MNSCRDQIDELSGSHTVPVLRVIVPAMYPNVNASIDRGTLDLDAYLYDDLQNQVHDRLSRVEQPTITNLLNTWVNSFIFVHSIARMISGTNGYPILSKPRRKSA